MYEKQLCQTETAIDNIVTAVMNGMASKALQAKLTELEETKEELLVRIEEEKLEKPKISAEFMTFWLHRFRKLDVTNVQHRRMLIDTFVNAVFLYDDKLLLTYNFKDGTRTITFNDVKTAANKAGSNLDCLGAPSKVPINSYFKLFWVLFLCFSFPHFSQKGSKIRRAIGGHVLPQAG